jgi:hypothetical protein
MKRDRGKTLLAFTAREDNEVGKTTAAQNVLRAVTETDSGVRVRRMDDADLDRILELRSIVRWSADPRAFDLLRSVRDARWAVAEAPDGDLAGMVGAVPLGDIGVLLSSWAVAYLRSRGAKTIRLYSTLRAEALYRSLGFEEVTPRTVYRLEEGPLRFRVPDRVYGHRVETLTFGDLPELYGVDRWSYGADRSALLFATLRLHPGRGLVVRDSTGRIKGYLIRSARGRATRIGPFLASTPDVAHLLLARALSVAGGTLVQVTVPGPAGCHAHSLLQEFGFEGTEDRMRMELGEKTTTCRTGLIHYGTTPYLDT